MILLFPIPSDLTLKPPNKELNSTTRYFVCNDVLCYISYDQNTKVMYLQIILIAANIKRCDGIRKITIRFYLCYVKY